MTDSLYELMLPLEEAVEYPDVPRRFFLLLVMSYVIPIIGLGVAFAIVYYGTEIIRSSLQTVLTVTGGTAQFPYHLLIPFGIAAGIVAVIGIAICLLIQLFVASEHNQRVQHFINVQTNRSLAQIAFLLSPQNPPTSNRLR